MANILPPGYLKWDGSKFILDPGTSGSISGDAGGDLSGTYPDPVVSKVNGTTITDTPAANQVLTSLNGTSAAWSEITDVHVGASAAIAGTKISPDFGSQNVKTSGNISAPTLGVGVGVSPPTITSGAGIPSSTPPEGSLYLRTNGDATTGAYVYQDAAWTAIGSGGGGSFTAGGDLTGSDSSQTVSKLQGADLNLDDKILGSFIRYDGYDWIATPSAVTLAGDVGGTIEASVVNKIRTVTVASATPTSNQVLTYNDGSGEWTPTALPQAATGAEGILRLAGDLAGVYNSVTVAKANGATIPAAGSLTTGNVLQVSGTSALSYGALNLAGGANYVTGVLPSANMTDATTGVKGIVQLAGDLAGTATSVSVAKINGSTVPAGGALTTGTILRATGSSALGYGALDLANASAVTGVLPSANLFQATTGTSGAVRLTGDLGGTAAAPTVVDLTIASEATGSMIYFNGTNWVNRSAGTANYILTANGAGAPTWNNSITAMTDVRSTNWGMEVVGGTNGKSEIFFDYFTTTSNTQYTARTITLAASKAYLISVNLFGTDGYTTYGGTVRTLHLNKAGKYYRAAAGGAILSGFSTVQDLTPSWGESPTIDLSFVIATNDIQIKVTGQSTYNAKWTMETKVQQVSI